MICVLLRRLRCRDCRWFLRGRALPFFIQASVIALLVTGCACPPFGRVLGTSPPGPDILQAGDLIWPRLPNVVVPVRAAVHEGSTGDPVQWEKEKQQYLAKLRAKSTLSPTERERYDTL